MYEICIASNLRSKILVRSLINAQLTALDISICRLKRRKKLFANRFHLTFDIYVVLLIILAAWKRIIAVNMMRSTLLTLCVWGALRAKFHIQSKSGKKYLWSWIFQQILRISKNPQTFIENMSWFRFSEIFSFVSSVSTLEHF